MSGPVRIAGDLHREIIRHAMHEAPNEAVGILARDQAGELVACFQMENVAASPVRYELDPADQWEALEAIAIAGLELGGIYHSHTLSPPVPSHDDVELAGYAVPYLIVGLAERRPKVRAWELRPGTTPVELELEVLPTIPETPSTASADA